MHDVERTPVISRSVATIGYDEEAMILDIEFRSGSLYRYFDVPEAVYRGLLSTTSIGRYVNAKIRNRYRFVEL